MVRCLSVFRSCHSFRVLQSNIKRILLLLGFIVGWMVLLLLFFSSYSSFLFSLLLIFIFFPFDIFVSILQVAGVRESLIFGIIESSTDEKSFGENEERMRWVCSFMGVDVFVSLFLSSYILCLFSLFHLLFSSLILCFGLFYFSFGSISEFFSSFFFSYVLFVANLLFGKLNIGRFCVLGLRWARKLCGLQYRSGLRVPPL